MVVEVVIKGHHAGYGQLKVSQSAPPDFFIFHTWYRPSAELVLCLREHSKVLPEVAIGVWMKIFAFTSISRLRCRRT